MRLGTLRNTQQINMQSAKKQQGFTLIELVVVIVILGILAVTAAPKFIDITSDAKGAVLDAAKASLNSATDMAHAKALVKGKTKVAGVTQKITVFSADDVSLNYGWPTNATIAVLVDLEDMTETSTKGVFQHDSAVTPANCKVTYDSASATATTRPTVVIVDSGC